MLRRVAPPIGWLLTGLLFGSGLPLASVKASPAIAKVDFNRDVRPIFSEHCYTCHGPDEKKRKAGLRLDAQADAFQELKSGNHALVAGDLTKSALVARITSTDPDEVMPPPKHNKPLTAEQIALLKRWRAVEKALVLHSARTSGVAAGKG
jgi:mono/diheme cytochrome c family protein